MPEIVESAEQARDLDYSYRVLDRVLLVGAAKYVLVTAVMVYLHVSVVFVVLFAMTGLVATLVARGYFDRKRKQRLVRFLHPATGELSVPGGPKPLRWSTILWPSRRRS